MIAAKVANALALDYPRERLEVIVACDGCTDATAARARARPAPTSCSSCPRGGKIRAQDAAVARARGEIVAFSDANAPWEPGAAARARRAPSPTRASATSCGQVRFVQTPAGDQPGGRSTGATRWRCARWSRGCPRSPAATARSTRPAATTYIVVDPIMGHDLSFPFNMVKRGLARRLRARGAGDARRWCPSIEGEFARKRRMMSHTWPIVLRGGMLSPARLRRGYALMIFSHRLLRYATPVPAPARAGRQRRAARARRRARLRGHARARSSRCSPPRWRAGARAARARC